VLGSGFGDLTNRIQALESISFADIPGMDQPSVAGHQGLLIRGTWAGQSVLVFAGRLHFYEGRLWSKVVQPVHIAQQLGVRILLLTNAAGGIRDDLVPGSLLAVNRHIEWTEPYCWRRPLTVCESPYDRALLDRLRQAARELGISLPTGVYAQVTGPCYETPAEIRALRSLGVDAVGMSTAREIQTGFDLGLACAALSCITNRAAGLGPGTIHHEEVLACTAQAGAQVGDLLERFVTNLNQRAE